MLPEIGASELLLIAIVALIVVGPKDLPALLRKLGQMMAKVRGMAAEFRSSFDEMARQSELDDLRKEVAAMRSGQLGDMSVIGDTRAEIDGAMSAMTNPYAYGEPDAFSEAAPEPAPKSMPKARPRTKTKAAKTTVAKVSAKPAATPPVEGGLRRRAKKIVEGGS